MIEGRRLCYKAKGNDVGKLCFCVRPGNDAGRLVYKKFGYLMTWWEFNQRYVGKPVALINGKVVCDGHATWHIIDYDVISDSYDVVENEDGSISYFFSMSLSRVFIASSCVFRCWDAGKKLYSTAKPEKRAEVFGSTSTVARFELHRNADETWYLRPVE